MCQACCPSCHRLAFRARLLSYMASHHVASTTCQAHCHHAFAHKLCVKPRLLSQLASYDAASSMCQTLLLGVPRRAVLRRQRVHRHGGDAVPEARARCLQAGPRGVGCQRAVALRLAVQLPGVHRAAQAARAHHGTGVIETERTPPSLNTLLLNLCISSAYSARLFERSPLGKACSDGGLVPVFNDSWLIENRHSTDVDCPPPRPRLCMSIHTQGKS
jgi:hypothetical protein